MMGHYTENAGSVRVDFFKESGKWGYTIECDMKSYYKGYLLPEALILALKDKFKQRDEMPFKGMTMVCMEPYHEFSHPIMVHKWDEYKT